ncbi:MAG: protein-export membrane protein SecF [SAR202 cluster bacterium Io17-Chloro-G3]|jgi:preprotein translocase subunit SecF|nr:protein translocase subunit SecF [SAR202 cluster bacterium]PKB66394.1 MAG: protein-export membrane protein SecF [SAR202 cluster bacterium Io17-Chloro-G3]|tara:strand:- start:1437 stop:2351 length:915 start_codon:yes stop_codon:yes gene_type:complete
MDFVGKRFWFFLISLLVITPGVIFLIIAPGLRPGIDFTGGSSMTLQFQESSSVTQQEMREALSNHGYSESTVQNLGNNSFFVRTKQLDEEAKDSLVEGLTTSLAPGSGNVLQGFDLVSPVVAQETVLNAFWAVLAAAVGIFFYVWWAFRNVPSPFRYGLAAIAALLHDATIVVGIFAILGEVLQMEVNTMFLIALLTVIGYSVNDTIVVFDKIRENVLIYANRPFPEIVNLSIAETIGRSINTSFTLLVTLLALILFGGATIREFLIVLLIGVVVGTYSSIAVASQILVTWEQKGIALPFGKKA